jgi:hypothetical protein
LLKSKSPSLSKVMIRLFQHKQDGETKHKRGAIYTNSKGVVGGKEESSK